MKKDLQVAFEAKNTNYVALVSKHKVMNQELQNLNHKVHELASEDGNLRKLISELISSIIDTKAKINLLEGNQDYLCNTCQDIMKEY